MIMDVILKCCLVQASADFEGGGIICHGGVHDPDAARYCAPAYCNNDLLQDSNFMYRTLIVLFLPNAHEPKWLANIDGTNTVTDTIIGNQIVLIQKT